VLFAGTIASNIAYGMEGIPQNEIKAAARMANCDFVWDMPMGFETKSKQLIAIAALSLTQMFDISWKDEFKWRSATEARYSPSVTETACYTCP
jgi:ABC-type protease/lipase transport system fused ATPase/permease subunit